MSDLNRVQLRILSEAEEILEGVWVDLTLAETDGEWNAIRDDTIRKLTELGEPEVFEAYKRQWDAAAAVIVPLVRQAQIANGIEPYTPEQYKGHGTAGISGKVKEEQVIKKVLPRAAKCIFSGMASLFFDGWYHLCCTMYCDSIPRLRLGHMDEVSFSDLENMILGDDFLFLMLKEGFRWYVDRMREFGMEVPERVCFPCVCCQMVFSNQAFLDRIADEVHERAERLRREQPDNR